eukprot:c26878_g3_i1 orf=18-275(-)
MSLEAKFGVFHNEEASISFASSTCKFVTHRCVNETCLLFTALLHCAMMTHADEELLPTVNGYEEGTKRSIFEFVILVCTFSPGQQ